MDTESLIKFLKENLQVEVTIDSDINDKFDYETNTKKANKRVEDA
jgi:hypothetical protein